MKESGRQAGNCERCLLNLKLNVEEKAWRLLDKVVLMYLQGLILLEMQLEEELHIWKSPLWEYLRFLKEMITRDALN